MGEKIEALLRMVTANAATDAFVLITLGVFLLALFFAWKRTHTRFLENAPGILTSLGILGTFVGIVIGLLNFDVSAIDQSIRQLLEGMKTAFITSLVGMLCSIIFKALDTWKFAQTRETGDLQIDVTPAHILESLERQNQTLKLLSHSLSAAEEGSVVGQLKLVRTDIHDIGIRHHQGREKFEKELFGEMKSFADLLSRSATEAVVEALRQVIHDFNRNLTEQFGDNFKALDASVKKLVEWQTQYSIQIEQMGQQFERSVETIHATRTAIEQIGQDCQRIPAAMDELRGVLEVNQHQIQELQRHLDAFVLMRDRAIEAVPEIQRQVQGVAEQLSSAAVGMGVILADRSEEFSNHVSRSNQVVIEMAHTVSSSTEEMTENLKISHKEMEAAAREMVRSLEQASNNVHQQVKICTEEMVVAIQRDTGRALNGVEKQIQTAVDKTGEAVNAQMELMDKAVAQELERIFQRFGASLVKISDAFTRDYGELTKKLADLSRSIA
ncbi:MotA/TolQ/ExbB proton channel family protein [Achromobacter piechaudii]|uniref:MotA/TolQ/ExbB proton channel domain-containing protein n=1 Tax=Achromobacter piechaudii TaxID=72556 RepID=A0A6S7DLW6_9BURK|nr:MotA/TolQ/ExbB proton channel family protein [Achromobacter piechaudii]CAB3834302.1 hypothetical protein LMG1861_00940 [Achromobacter piechaudii]